MPTMPSLTVVRCIITVPKSELRAATSTCRRDVLFRNAMYPAISCRFGSFKFPQHLETPADSLRIKGRREHGMVAGPGINQKYRRGVIDGVVFHARCECNLIRGAQLTRQVAYLCVVSGYAEKGRIKIAHVLAELISGIAIW